MNRKLLKKLNQIKEYKKMEQAILKRNAKEIQEYIFYYSRF